MAEKNDHPGFCKVQIRYYNISVGRARLALPRYVPSGSALIVTVAVAELFLAAGARFSSEISARKLL